MCKKMRVAAGKAAGLCSYGATRLRPGPQAIIWPIAQLSGLPRAKNFKYKITWALAGLSIKVCLFTPA